MWPAGESPLDVSVSHDVLRSREESASETRRADRSGCTATALASTSTEGAGAGAGAGASLTVCSRCGSVLERWKEGRARGDGAARGEVSAATGAGTAAIMAPQSRGPAGGFGFGFGWEWASPTTSTLVSACVRREEGKRTSLLLWLLLLLLLLL